MSQRYNRLINITITCWTQLKLANFGRESLKVSELEIVIQMFKVISLNKIPN